MEMNAICVQECLLKSELEHARTAETCLMAKIAELSQKLERQRTSITELEIAVEDVRKRLPKLREVGY